MKLDILRSEIIGRNKKFTTPYGERIITYTDYTASGKPLKFVEKYMMEIEQYYANTHTEDDLTGELMTKLLHKSEKIIKEELNAANNCYVIPAGTGATGAILSFSKIIGVYMPPATKNRIIDFLINSELSRNSNDYVMNLVNTEFNKKMPVVFIGPYEHHSNILMWRESLVEVVEIGLDQNGYLDLADLEKKVSDSRYENRFKIGSFSAASNVTGIKTDVYEVAMILHANKAIACFDFAASAPYVEINMNKNKESYFDAVFFSPHKFIGGPGAAGILVINSKLYDNKIPPTVSGGGTVDYVSSIGQDYLDNVEEREKAGTPGILQVIKAGLAIQLKGRIGTEIIEEKEQYFTEKIIKKFKDNPAVEILGPADPSKRVSIISFMIKYKDRYLHHRFVTKLMNDLFGIQSRAGCACAGPYGHSLLKIGAEKSLKFREIILNGINSLKPGWVRINFHYAMSEYEVDFIIEAIDFVSKNAYLFLKDYTVDLKTGGWSNINIMEEHAIVRDFGINESYRYIGTDISVNEEVDTAAEYKQYLSEAETFAMHKRDDFPESFNQFKDDKLEALNWFYFINCENNTIVEKKEKSNDCICCADQGL